MSFMEKINNHLVIGAKDKKTNQVMHRSYDLTLLQDEVVARTNKAEISFKLSIDSAKVTVEAERALASELASWESSGKEAGEPKPSLEAMLKQAEEQAAWELKKASRSDLRITLGGDFHFPDYELLKAEIKFGKRTVTDVSQIDFVYDGGEVSPVGESSYKFTNFWLLPGFGTNFRDGDERINGDD